MNRIALACILIVCFFGRLHAADMSKSTLSKDLTNTDFYAYSLIESAHNDPSKIMDYLLQAQRLSPDLPAVYFHLAWVTLTTSPTQLYDSINYLIKGFSSYTKNFWWALNLGGIVMIGVLLAYVFTIVMVVLVRLSTDMPLLNHEIKENGKNFIALILAFFMSAMGPLYFLAAMMMLVSFYFKKSDIVITYVFFGTLILMPLIVKPVELFLTAEISPRLRAIVTVNEGQYNASAMKTLQNADTKEELFSLALAQKRAGMTEKAITTYNTVLKKYPHDPALYNNLGTAYMILGKLEKAQEMYDKAIKIRPLASTYYNMSLLFGELLQFNEGEQYFAKAQRIDADAVKQFRENSSAQQKLLYVDETLRKTDFWRYAGRLSQPSPFILISPFSRWIASLIGLMIAATFYILLKYRKNKAHSCKRCGTIICPKCERSLKWGGMCNDCFLSLVTFEKDPRDRIAKLLNVYDTKTKKKNIVLFLTLLIPGSQLIYVGKILKGALITFLFALSPMIFIASLTYRISIYPFTHSWLISMLILTTTMLYILNIAMTRRFLKKWV